MKLKQNMCFGFSFDILMELQYLYLLSNILHFLGASSHCNISSLPILQHPLLQTFMPLIPSPQNHQLFLQSSTCYTAIPYNVSSSSSLASLVPWALSHNLYLSSLLCQLGLFKAPWVLTCRPAAASCLQTTPCPSAAGPTNGSERGSVGLL